jgi:hypothetical protein
MKIKLHATDDEIEALRQTVRFLEESNGTAHYGYFSGQGGAGLHVKVLLDRAMHEQKIQHAVAQSPPEPVNPNAPIHACVKCGMPGATRYFPGGYVCPQGCNPAVIVVPKPTSSGFVDALTGKPVMLDDPANGSPCPKCGSHSVVSDQPSIERCLKCGWDND